MTKHNYRKVGSNRLAQLIGVRIKAPVKHRLGNRLWKDFSRKARRVGNKMFVDAFTPDTMICSGTIDGTPCPIAGVVKLDLRFIHADHT